MERAHRAGTAKVYDSKWNKWLAWCEEQKVDPIRPYAIQLSNFLSSLAGDSALLPATIKVHRSAIVSTLNQRGGRVRGLSAQPRLISDVLKGISASAASSPRRVPKWDLFLVLDFLRQQPFEPLSRVNRKFLTLKTVFLISLASGRRASEVNALSGLAEDVARERDGSFILNFLPEFRAKNQQASDPSPSVRIPPLSSILAPDDEDVSLCPVRALRRYRSSTAASRAPGCRKLFTSINPNCVRDVSANTVSRWVATVVRLAYEKAGQTLPANRAHEVRAWSASLAAARNMPLQEILAAAYWRAESTFINYYLRDCSLSREDGTHSISALVVAQRAIRLH